MRALFPVACLALLLAGCGGAPEPGQAPAEESGPPATVYSVRGVIADLPAEGQARDWLAVRHEAIPDFVGIGGEIESMHAMTMRFPVAEGVDLAGSAVGDKIAFELEVDWNAGEPARVISLSSLPPETELELGGG